MIPINKEEATYLRASGAFNDVHVSSRTKKSKGKRYYATESFKTMKLLDEYRSKNVLSVYGR